MTIFLAPVALSLVILQPLGQSATAGQDPRPGPALAGRVLHSELPVPGAAVTVVRGDKTHSTITDEDGAFQFATVDPGTWTLKVEMRGFAPVIREIAVPPSEPALSIALTMRSYAEVVGENAVKSAWPAVPAIPAIVADGAEIVNGSITNGAATRFAQPRAMGNNRPKGLPLYSGAFTGNFGNSGWNAAPYSFGGPAAPVPDYADTQLAIMIAGPLKIPFTSWGSQARLAYRHGVQNTANTRSALVPTFSQRSGDLSSHNGAIRDPRTGLPFEGNIIPAARIVPQATALLALYPEPSGTIDTGANFQRAVLGTVTSDRLQADLSRSFGPRTQVAGSVSYERIATDSVNLFGFEDRTGQSALNATFSWSRRIKTRLNIQAMYGFSNVDNRTTPYFANKSNISGDAGITGNAQDPLNWGPPTIVFPDFAELTDGRYQDSNRYSHTVSGQVQWRRGAHNITFGADARLNNIHQHTHPDPRGTLNFTGAVTGYAFADFLLGIPATSSIAFGNISTTVRGNQLSAFFADDLRLGPGLTLDLGVRWEYESPYSEEQGQLANLDILPDFSDVAIVTPGSTGSLTGSAYPDTLVRRDPFGFEPRVGLSWRPMLTSSLVIKTGYGLYRNLGVYQSIGASLAQQPPFSSAFSVQNTIATPLTLANPFPAAQPARTTFAVDPDFRAALAHSWHVSVQRDLPASLTIIAAYLGDKGVQLPQAFLPNTYPPGAANPCPPCPTGFTYLTSGGTSLRNAMQIILRRRLYAGFTSTLTYTLAKSTDNAATFSNTNVSPSALAVAQDWRDLEAERGPSSFDQRHLTAIEVQYTTGVGILGGTLVDNFWGRLYKDWTLTAQLNSGTGLPVTPIAFLGVPGTGTVGVRPTLTGAPIVPQDEGSYANGAAFVVPARGSWGNAGRNSIRGPSTFTFDMSVARTFRFTRRFNLDWRVTASNVLNRVTFTTIDRVITSPQFGRSTNAGQMRRIMTNFVFRF
jgi:trimeric autotransporter adhesin